MIETSLPPRAELQSDPALLPLRPFGEVARSVAGYALLMALMIIVDLPVFVPAALFHCAIRNGRRATWAALALSVTVSALLFAASIAKTPDLQSMMWSSLAGTVLVIAIPSIAAVPLVERAEKFGRVVIFLLAGALLGTALTEVASQRWLSFSPYAASVEQAKEMGVKVVETYRQNQMPPSVISLAERWTEFSMYVLPAQVLIAATFTFLVSLLLLGRLKAWRERAVRRGDGEALAVYLFRNFQLPDWVLFAFIFGGLTPLVTGLLQKVAANTLVLVVVLYIIQGLAIFRSILVAMSVGPGGALIGWSLLALLFLMGIGPLLLAVAGLFDPFFDFRHFKKRKDDSHESHSD